MNDSPPPGVDSATRAALDSFLRQVAERFPLHEAILYGSRARGDARPDSDADVMLLLHGTPEPFMRTKLDMADIAFDAMLDTGIRVQPLPVWGDEWREPDTWSNPELLRNIEQTGIRVWPAPLI